MSKLKTYWNTVKYLKLGQIISRISNEIKSKQRVHCTNYPTVRQLHLAITEIDCDEVFCSRFKVERISEGEVCLLNHMVKTNYSYDYTHSVKPLIHNNVYYFEYAVALGARYRQTGDSRYIETFKRCYIDYLASDANVRSSYIMSLHIPNLLITMDLMGEALDEVFKEKVYCELYSQYLYLKAHQETHLLANHYFENLKAVIIAAYLFGEDKKCVKFLQKLKDQCEEQILKDGMHYELSPMYHKLIQEDLLRIAVLRGQGDFPVCEWIVPTIQKMTDAMCFLEKGIGRTPLFNDSGDNVAKTCRSLVKAVKRVCGVEPNINTVLAESGYFKMAEGKIALILDAGKIGVDYQPAHGHSDCLSFELAYDGQPLFVNQGTYEYQGNKRKQFKLTMAHNTLVINGHEQNQCWGGFRVGNRIKNVKGHLSDFSFEGEYTNIFGEKHERSVSLCDGVLQVWDSTSGTGMVKSYLHIAPEYKVVRNTIIRKRDEKEVALWEAIGCSVTIKSDGKLCEYAPEFGKMEKCSCIVFSWKIDDIQHGYKIIFRR